jgi:type I restriction enzyme S subunit
MISIASSKRATKSSRASKLTDRATDILPASWRRASLGVLVRPRREKIHPSALPDYPYIGMEHVEAHSMRLLETVPARQMRSSANRFYSGDVLYGRLRPYLNKVHNPAFDGLCSAEFIVFPKTEGIDPRFLTYRLNAADFAHFATHLNAGDRPRVDFDQISAFQILLPPLAEQQRIVAEIEKQLTRLDAAVASLKRVQTALKRYRASVLKAACEGRLVPTEAELARREKRRYESADVLLQRILRERRDKWNRKGKYKEPATPNTEQLPSLPEGWAWATVEQLAAPEPNSITDGPFGSNLKTEHYTNSGPRVIRLQNIGDGVYVDEEAHISEAHFQRLQKHRVYADDLVIAGFGENPPRSCIIPEALGPAIVKADCIRFKPHREIAAKYMNAALNSEAVRRWTKGMVHGVGRPRLNLGEIKSIVLPVPPLAEQDRVAGEAERRLSVIEELETAISTEFQRAIRLRQSILRRAFSGELTFRPGHVHLNA